MNVEIVDRGNGYAALVQAFPDLSDFKAAWLGDYQRLVVSGQPGIFFTRTINGGMLLAANALGVPPIPHLPVIVGKDQAGTWHIIRALTPSL